MLSRPWPRRLTPDRARPWFGEPPPRCLTSCYDRLRQTLRRPLELGLHTAIAVMDEAPAPHGPALVPSLLQRGPHDAGVSGAEDTPATACPRTGGARPVGYAAQR